MNKVIAAVIVLAAFGTKVNAQTNVATATADAKIVSAITIASSRALNFGSIAPGAGGTVEIDATSAGARNTSLAVTNAASSSAKFTVSGEGNSTYSIAVTNATVTLTNGTPADDMSATIIASADGTNASTATGTLASGTQDIYVGGTLTVANAQAAGVYTAANAIEITVAYN
ncbi:MAG: hypothetical protein JWQ09_5226 [Segetibacter sp.]|nr:hypothetical protein [Segetibacter sp.]